jgi:AcrR family transcriptional regulator
MKQKKLDTNAMSERIVQVTLDLIEENGGLQGVNLRQIAHRAECAHTNIYNYFADFDDLLWEVYFRISSRMWQDYSLGLEDDLSLADVVRRVCIPQIDFAIEHPGLYRCVWIEPLSSQPPARLLDIRREMRDVVALKIRQACPGLTLDQANEIFSVMFSYTHGALSLLVNGRINRQPLPEYRDHMIANAILIVETISKSMLNAEVNDAAHQS